MPDFIIRLKTSPPSHLILETKGFDPREEVKRAAAERWVAAVNADGTYGIWRYALAKKTTEVSALIDAAVRPNKPASKVFRSSSLRTRAGAVFHMQGSVTRHPSYVELFVRHL